MRADPKPAPVLAQGPAELAKIGRLLTKVAAGTRGRALIDDLRTLVGGSPSDIVRQTLFADCLRVVHSAAIADGLIEDAEIEALYGFIAAAAQCYAAGLRSQYGELAVVDLESARAFLDRYAADRGPLGRGARIRWPGLMLCRRAAELGEPEALERYAKLMAALAAEACRLGGVAGDDPRWRSSTDELGELQRMLSAEATATAQAVDRRVQAFLAPCRVFGAVQQASSIFENDPFDVEEVHREARAAFAQLVAHATTTPAAHQGQMLVVLGDSGAGKTHLLRGFRHHVQEGSRGFVVYAQLQARTEDYSRYLLFHFIESLSRRYAERSGRTGLGELATGLLQLARPALRERLERLAEDTWESRTNLVDHVDELVGELLGIPALASFDLDLLRVLVYALLPDPRTTSSVYRYLHCDAMNAHDRRWIGDVTPRTRDDDPHRMICALARFAAATGRALVVMVDQVDLAGFEESSTVIFRRAIDALYRIVSEIPSSVAVVACLSDLYSAARPTLNRPALDRLEKAPPLAKLQINRSYAEIEAVVARRLSWLFAEHGTVHRREQPVYPIPEAELRQLEHRRLRDVLEWCHQFQAQCAAAGKIIGADEPVTVEIKTRELDLDAIAAAWSEAIRSDLEIPSDGEEILAVVAEAAKAYAHELGLAFAAQPAKQGVLRVSMSRGQDHAALAIAVVNQPYQRGAFTGQIESLRKRAKGMLPIAVRTLEFPRGPACDKAMGLLIHMRGRGAYLDASTLRALVAFQRFQPPFPAERIAAWTLRDRPISSLSAVTEIFDFDRSRVEAAEPSQVVAAPEIAAGAVSAAEATAPIKLRGASPPQPGARRSVARPTTVAARQLWIGNTTGFDAAPILLDADALLRHVAIVDGAATARCAAALTLVEQTLEAGVPAILIDPTGEMSGYARPDWWQRSDDPARARRLAERTDVRLFTPGIRGGRPLSVAVIPDLSRVPSSDHDGVISRTADAVATALRSDPSPDEPHRFATLTRAIAVLAGRAAPCGLLELIALIETGADALGEASPDDQVRQRLVDDLVKLLGNPDVFTPGAEPLTAATLVGPAGGGQVPLAIVNTSFLDAGPRLRAWISHLVFALRCERAASRPTTLETLLVFDEAEQLLCSASGKPPAPDPVQELLGPASGAGLGIVLTSRRPGELDYRRCGSIETWFVGKTEPPTLEKMKPLFAQHPLGHRNPSRLESGRFVMLRQGSARDVERGAPLLRIEQLAGTELKHLAARTHPRARAASPAPRANVAG